MQQFVYYLKSVVLDHYMYCFCNAYVVDLYLSVLNMCCLCMIATIYIPLPTRNKLNCFISAWGMLTIISIIWHCALLLLFFFVDFAI